MMYNDPDGNFRYMNAINWRQSYLDDAADEENYFGAVDYVGDHAIMTGYNNPGTGVSGEFAVIVLRVGRCSIGEVATPYIHPSLLSAVFGSSDAVKIREMHLFAKKSFAELANIVTEG